MLLASCWNRNALPGDIDLVPELSGVPKQTGTRRSPFDVFYEGAGYRVEPEYAYELHGLVVSYRHHDGNSRMHRMAGDHLNMLDVCVVWGDNAANGHLVEFDFWNGIFTCNYGTKSNEAWAAFDETAVSNNHLLSDDPIVRGQVRGLRVGDQVRVRGLLASYTSGNGSVRGTSTTRTDTGDGACETIWVESFEILRRSTSAWQLAFWVALCVFLGSLAVYFMRPYRPHT